MFKLKLVVYTFNLLYVQSLAIKLDFHWVYKISYYSH